MRTLFRKLGQVGWSFPIILALVALCVASLFAITSATSGNDLLKDASASQLKYIIAGFVVYLVIALTPYQLLVKISPILYAVGVVLLAACFVPHIGRNGHGAASWIKLGPIGFEPAEFAKIAYILAMAWFLRVRENKIQSFTTVLMACAFTAIPFLLVLKQPALSGLLRHAFCGGHAGALFGAAAGTRGAGHRHGLLLDSRVGQAGAFPQGLPGLSHQGVFRSQPRPQGRRLPGGPGDDRHRRRGHGRHGLAAGNGNRARVFAQGGDV
jgi:hypothetical protein